MNNLVEDKKDKEDEEYQEIAVTLRLKKNIAKVARILAIGYSEHKNPPPYSDFDKFISEEVTKVIFALAANPREPSTMPDSLKRHLKNLLMLNNNNNEANTGEKSYLQTDYDLKKLKDLR